MFYVIQIEPGTETLTEELIAGIVPEELYSACFHPMRHMRKKIRGNWKDLHEKLIPGYVFIESDHVGELYEKLRTVPKLTKVLGREGDLFYQLPEKEAHWLKAVLGMDPDNPYHRNKGGYEIELSQVCVSENDEVMILSGPLMNFTGMVKKLNLHKRLAEVEVDFMNQKIVVHVGIELVQRTEKD